jgi:GGDEF domain-containing protein
VLVDVDSFTSINDNHGHPVGDDVLVHLAAVLRGEVPAEDLLEAVRSAPMTLADGTLLVLSISVGVAHVPQHSSDQRDLYAAADNALYDAKRAGRGRVSVATTRAPGGATERSAVPVVWSGTRPGGGMADALA